MSLLCLDWGTAEHTGLEEIKFLWTKLSTKAPPSSGSSENIFQGFSGAFISWSERLTISVWKATVCTRILQPSGNSCNKRLARNFPQQQHSGKFQNRHIVRSSKNGLEAWPCTIPLSTQHFSVWVNNCKNRPTMTRLSHPRKANMT